MAAAYKLDNLVAILDFNGLQIDGKIYRRYESNSFLIQNSERLAGMWSG